MHVTIPACKKKEFLVEGYAGMARRRRLEARDSMMSLINKQKSDIQNSMIRGRGGVGVGVSISIESSRAQKV